MNSPLLKIHHYHQGLRSHCRWIRTWTSQCIDFRESSYITLKKHKFLQEEENPSFASESQNWVEKTHSYWREHVPITSETKGRPGSRRKDTLLIVFLELSLANQDEFSQRFLLQITSCTFRANLIGQQRCEEHSGERGEGCSRSPTAQFQSCEIQKLHFKWYLHGLNIKWKAGEAVQKFQLTIVLRTLETRGGYCACAPR